MENELHLEPTFDFPSLLRSHQLFQSSTENMIATLDRCESHLQELFDLPPRALHLQFRHIRVSLSLLIKYLANGLAFGSNRLRDIPAFMEAMDSPENLDVPKEFFLQVIVDVLYIPEATNGRLRTLANEVKKEIEEVIRTSSREITPTTSNQLSWLRRRAFRINFDRYMRHLSKLSQSSDEFVKGSVLYSAFWTSSFHSIRSVLDSSDPEAVERLRKSVAHWRLTSAEFDFLWLNIATLAITFITAKVPSEYYQVKPKIRKDWRPEQKYLEYPFVFVEDSKTSYELPQIMHALSSAFQAITSSVLFLFTITPKLWESQPIELTDLLSERRYFLFKILSPAVEELDGLLDSLRKFEKSNEMDWQKKVGEEFNHLIDDFKDLEKIFTDVFNVHIEKPIRQIYRVLLSTIEDLDGKGVSKDGMILQSSRSSAFFSQRLLHTGVWPSILVKIDESKVPYLEPVIENLISHLKSLVDIYGLIGLGLETYRDILLGDKTGGDKPEEGGDLEVESVILELEEVTKGTVEEMKRSMNRLISEDHDVGVYYQSLVRKRNIGWRKLLWP